MVKKYIVPFLLVGMVALFALTATPPGIGFQAQHHDTNYAQSHDLTGGGLKAIPAPEVQPGATNVGQARMIYGLTLFSLLGLFVGFAVVGSKRQPVQGVRACVGEACGT